MSRLGLSKQLAADGIRSSIRQRFCDKFVQLGELNLSAFDKGRSFDKYVVSDKAPADPATVSFTATFSKDKDGTLKFRTENAKDAAQRDFWGDGVHSKSHHQQGTDLVRSKKYINATQTMTCADCHDPHGKTGK